MSRQADIDKICTWMGWELHHVGLRGHWYWQDTHLHKMAESFFDPFTNPSDCARVMEAVKDDWELEKNGPTDYICRILTYDIPGGKGITECEAKMGAVLAMIGG